jgi:hypothetical protein
MHHDGSLVMGALDPFDFLKRFNVIKLSWGIDDDNPGSLSLLEVHRWMLYLAP